MLSVNNRIMMCDDELSIFLCAFMLCSITTTLTRSSPSSLFRPHLCLLFTSEETTSAGSRLTSLVNRYVRAIQPCLNVPLGYYQNTSLETGCSTALVTLLMCLSDEITDYYTHICYIDNTFVTLTTHLLHCQYICYIDNTFVTLTIHLLH